MKKLFLIGYLILITSCQAISPTPQIESTPLVTLPTPTETITPAPTFTATPIFTPTAIPLFFTEEFSADLSAWTFFQTGGAQSPAAVLENDTLHIQMTSPNTWYYNIHNAHEYSKAFISAKFSAAPSGSVGLVCNYSQANGWFEFNISHEGRYNILFGTWLAEGIAQYKPIFKDGSEYLQIGNLNYEIGLTCIENTLLLHINGKMFRKVDVTRFGLTQGKIGITASSYDNVPMDALFEWVKVSAPE